MGAPDFQRLFESTPGLYAVLDRSFRTVAASDAYLRATMTRREDLVGRSIFDVFPANPADTDASGPRAVRAVMERALRERKPQKLPVQRYDLPRPAERGGGFEKRYWSATVTPLAGPGGEIEHLFCSVEDVSHGGTVAEYELDVSARKAAEEARRQSEQRYRTLFESIDAGFCVVELVYKDGRPVDYRFIEVNPAFERQTGLRNATGTTIRQHVPEHEQHWFDLYAEVAETGEPARFVQEAKGLGRWYEVFAFRAGQDGRPRVGVLFNDITTRVEHEKAQREAARRKDEFLATLAHELRNPLAPISNAVSILRLREGDEDLRLVGDMIDRQVRHLVRLVDDLLDVSRITFGKITLQRRRLDLRDAANDAVATSEPQLTAGQHRLEVALGAQPVWVDADPVRLSQVISNLLNNAARYTRQAGKVVLRVTTEGGEACIAVEDNGVGIEPAMLERIFEPFVQIEQRDIGAVGGIGIGLALARALVRLHGGSIRAESGGAGKGSRFVVCLPLAAAPGKAEAGEAPAQGSRRRFLIVDDNVDATLTQAQLLRHLGHEVDTAYNGATALEKAKAFRPDIVLLDLGMPGMDGFEVARRLRAMPEGRGALIVAQTGWGQEEDRRRTQAAGFDAHLAKPVDVSALMRLV